MLLAVCLLALCLSLSVALLTGYYGGDLKLLLLAVLFLGLSAWVFDVLWRWQRKLQSQVGAEHFVHFRQTLRLEGGQGTGWLGDWSCVYNARSPLLRCTVNPGGSCSGCVHYKAVSGTRWRRRSR